MPVTTSGAQRASIRRSLRLTVFTIVAALVVGLGAMANPPETSAATSIKVVIVVGPVGSKTEEYRNSARHYARVARAYGAKTTEIYSPYATWTKVKSALQGANMLIYLGHGNGYPSPYGSFQKYTKNGMGLNAASGRGNSNTKYWGEYYIDRDIQMAKNSVVLLNRLCYASGNSEWGAANPTKATAIKRVDNYGAGFLRAGARVVFAEGIGSIAHQIRALLTGRGSMEGIFMSHPDASSARDFYVMSKRTTWAKVHMDPPRAGKYWRSVIGDLRMSAIDFRGG